MTDWKSDTELFELIKPQLYTPVVGEADDISWAAVYLCSSAAQFVTGVVLPVDRCVSFGF